MTFRSLHDLKDPVFFKKLFFDQYSSLCEFAYKYTKDDAVSEDIVQEVFTYMWKNRSSVTIKTTLSSYLFGAVRNACLNHLKHEKVKLNYQTIAKSNDHDFNDFLEIEELEKIISETLNSLPEKCRMVFEMSRYQQKTYPEIATQLDISIKTVETHIGKALRAFKKALEVYMKLILFFLNFFQN